MKHTEKSRQLVLAAALATAVPAFAAEQLGILTPPEGDAPRICGPSVFGVRPGHPFWYRVPATGARPLAVDVDIPEYAQGAFRYDASTRLLSGTPSSAGVIEFTFSASNSAGRAARKFTLRVGDRLALTPPMGWNSWNGLGAAVSEEKVLQTAESLVSSGLADHGWMYVNVDDHWARRPDTEGEAVRGADGTIRHNTRFVDMRRLADGIHALGLRFGLYSTPGPDTCGGCAGSWGHVRRDAATFAEWGVDYLKYDWCQYGKNAPGRGWRREILPFQLMGRALREQPRDIVYSVCQYGRALVPAWGENVGGQCWRVSGDLYDDWNAILRQVRAMDGMEAFVRPGAWNDPDMLVIGMLRTLETPTRPDDFAPALHPSRLTPNEQYTHMSLWALCAAPLLLGTDPAALDPFTRSLVTNDEVIDIDQDILGMAAACIVQTNSTEVWARPLADGSIAAGLVNLADEPREVSFSAEACGMEGVWSVRDVWRQRDEPPASGTYAVRVPAHATHLVKFIPQPGARLAPRLSDIRENALRRFFPDG